MSWSQLPAPARAVAVAASEALDAVADHDRGRFDEATTALAATDGTGLVLGTAARLLMEELHPDGLDGDDVRAVLAGCVSSAGEWLPDVDPQVVLVLLMNALGVHPDGSEVPLPDPAQVARHGPLLVADLVAGVPGPADRYLAAALREVQRGELHD